MRDINVKGMLLDFIFSSGDSYLVALRLVGCLMGMAYVLNYIADASIYSYILYIIVGFLFIEVLFLLFVLVLGKAIIFIILPFLYYTLLGMPVDNFDVKKGWFQNTERVEQ
jgi:hypothetical protein